jgi:hypothetical protein
MGTVTTMGLDIAKSVFQVHGIDAACDVVVRRRLSRGRVLAFCRDAWSGWRRVIPRIIGPAS